MRILFVSQYFYPEQFSNNNIVRFLQERGHQVEVLTAAPNYPEGRFYDGYGPFKNRKGVYHGARITRVPVVPRGQRNLLKLSLNYLSFAATGAIWTAKRQFRDVDVIFCSVPSPITMALPAIAAKKMSGKPLVIWMQDLWPESVYAISDIKSPLFRKTLERTCRYIYRSADFTLVQSRNFEPWIRRYAPDSRFGYFPNTTEAYHRPLPADTALRASLSIPDDRIVITYAGNVGETQNFGVIIDAALTLRDAPVTFQILGDGRARGPSEERIAAAGLTDMFRFVGKVPAEKVPDYLSYSDAAILTLKDVDIFAATVPFRMQTFLACGKPVIASAEGAAGDIVDAAQCGFVSKPGDGGALAENIRRFIALPAAERQAMGQRARTYALDNFDRDKVFSYLETVLAAEAARTSGRPVR